ncbi:MAG: hypothetical protein OEW33_05000 [Nitrospirota bacterium]|nr:hypothetical protein [Nitrospirota bacterium]
MPDIVNRGAIRSLLRMEPHDHLAGLTPRAFSVLNSILNLSDRVPHLLF